MKRILALAVLLTLAVMSASAWQFGGSGDTNKGSLAPLPPKKAPTTRTLTGQVLSQQDAPLAKSVVYLKDTRTLNVKTYIANSDGSYQFAGLSFNQDYELHAEHDGSKSSTKTLSSFDSRAAPVMNLKVEEKKK